MSACNDLFKESLEACRAGWNRCFAVLWTITILLLIDGLSGGPFLHDAKSASIELGGFKVPRIAFSFTYCALSATFFFWAVSSAKTVRTIVEEHADSLGDLSILPAYRLWLLSPIHPSVKHRRVFWFVVSCGMAGLWILGTIHLAGINMPDPQEMSPAAYRLIGLPCLFVFLLYAIAIRRLYGDWKYVRLEIEARRTEPDVT